MNCTLPDPLLAQLRQPQLTELSDLKNSCPGIVSTSVHPQHSHNNNINVFDTLEYKTKHPSYCAGKMKKKNSAKLSDSVVF